MQLQIDDKCRLLIPKTFLDNLNIKPNDFVDLILVNNVLSMRKSPNTDHLKKLPQIQAIDATATSNSITLSWNYDKSDDRLFYIFKSENKQFNIVLNNPHQVTSLKHWTDFSVLQNKEYFYRIVACNNIGTYSLPSLVTSAKTHMDEMPIIKVDREQKNRLAKEELQKQIEDNTKNADTLRKRLDKI